MKFSKELLAFDDLGSNTICVRKAAESIRDFAVPVMCDNKRLKGRNEVLE